MSLTAVLSACGVSVEQAPGSKVRASAALSGNWDTSIDLPGAQRGILSITPSADELVVQWSGKGAEGVSATAALFEHKGKQYVAVSNSPQAGGYFILRIEDISADQIRARALDGERTAQLLKQMKRPAVYRELWLHKELFLDKATFAALMEHHADALFDKGVAITLDKVR